MFKFIRSLFITPSSFENDPKGFALNQFLHMLIIGYIPSYILGPEFLLFLLIGYAVWEFLQWAIWEAKPWDCFEDWGFMSGGAIAVFHPWVFVTLSAWFVSGYLRRLRL